MVQKYGSEQIVRDKILNQLRQVEGMYTGFSHVLKLTPVSWNMYSGNSEVQVYLPHPEAALLVVYDYYNDAFPPNGGWGGADYHFFVQSWHQELSPGVFDNDVFGPNPTAGFGHELGHGFGAIDIYKMDVNDYSNPINGVGYRSETSIYGNSMMRYPYAFAGQWDPYSRCIIEKSNGQLEQAIPVVSQTLPKTYQVKVTSASGASINGASVKLYSKSWDDTYSIPTTSSMSGQTDATGVMKLPVNPFHPMEDPDAPWRTATPNSLVLVTWNGQTSYGWLTIADAGMSACTDQTPDHSKPFVITVKLPS